MPQLDEEKVQPLRDLLSALYASLVPILEEADYGNDIVMPRLPKGPKSKIVLTGSTSTIGRYVLRALLDHPDIEHIYCLNRTADSKKQAELNAATDTTLPTQFNKRSVSFIASDFAAPYLGVGQDAYETLRREADYIVHVSWPTGTAMRQPLSYFEPSLHGLVNLLKLTKTGLKFPKLVFVSSVAATAAADLEVIPEEVLLNPHVCRSIGYSQSKWIAENLCELAARDLGIPTSIIRVGQVCGALNSTGAWRMDDVMPSILLSSAYLGALPDTMTDAVLWMPIDVLAQVMVELTFSSSGHCDIALEAEVFAPINHNLVTWRNVIEYARTCIAQDVNSPSYGKEVSFVPNTVWLEKLRHSADRTSEPGLDTKQYARVNPALRDLPLLEAVLTAAMSSHKEKRWASENAQVGSETLRNVKPVSEDDLRRWMGQWFLKLKIAPK